MSNTISCCINFIFVIFKCVNYTVLCMHGPGVIQATAVRSGTPCQTLCFFLLVNDYCLSFISPDLLTYPCTSGLYLMKKGKYDKNPAIIFDKR